MYKIRNQKAIVGREEANRYIRERCNRSLASVARKLLPAEIAERVEREALSGEEFCMDFADALALKKMLVVCNNSRVPIKNAVEEISEADFDMVVDAIEEKVQKRHLSFALSKEEVLERTNAVFSVNSLPDVFLTEASAKNLPKVRNVTVR